MSNALVKITILNKTAEINYLKTNLIHDDSVAFNDGLLDQKGHLWVGTMDKSFQNNTGSLYRISSSGEIVMMDEGFYISNGMGWSPNNEKFYFVDSLARVIYEYHFNVEKCNIDKRRILIEFTEDQGFPDGLYIDKMGYIWVAGWASYKVYQYSPKGELINSVQFPAKNLTSCCFGGHNLKTLFVTSASFDVLSNIKDVGEPAGSVFILN
jgi:sugar lactone lactonase YvrE